MYTPSICETTDNFWTGLIGYNLPTGCMLSDIWYISTFTTSWFSRRLDSVFCSSPLSGKLNGWIEGCVTPRLYTRILTHFDSDSNTTLLLVYVFSPPTPCCSSSMSLFFSLHCEVLKSWFLMPSSHVSLCSLDLFFLVTLIDPQLFTISTFFLGVRCFDKPAGCFCFDICSFVDVIVSFEGTHKWYLCKLLIRSFTPSWHQPQISALYLRSSKTRNHTLMQYFSKCHVKGSL